MNPVVHVQDESNEPKEGCEIVENGKRCGRKIVMWWSSGSPKWLCEEHLLKARMTGFTIKEWTAREQS